VRVPAIESEEAWALRLVDAGVRVHPGYFFELTGGAHLVLSLLPAPAAFAHGISRLRAVLDQS
jgi:hypothetical protein